MDAIAAGHFEELTGAPVHRAHCLNSGELDLPPVDTSALEHEFTNNEIWAAISALPPDKAPVPDRFSLRFYQVC